MATMVLETHTLKAQIEVNYIKQGISKMRDHLILQQTILRETKLYLMEKVKGSS
jgi:hypothetical protein